MTIQSIFSARRWLASGLALAAVCASAANWPQWRGPDFNGSSPETGLPESWSKTNGVKWATDLPGPSAATTAIWGDTVFLTAGIKDRAELWALALDRRTGKERWRKQVGSGFQQDERSNFSAPSPVTDGNTVWFFFGNGELAAFDFSGQLKWSRNLQKEYGPFAFLWTFSTSPLLYEGRLYLQVLQRDVPVGGRGRPGGKTESFLQAPDRSGGKIDSFLLALEPQTGKELWRRVRPSDAREESREAFSTPVPVVQAGRAELLIAGGDCFTGHDPATGAELWRWGTWNPQRVPHWRLVPSPVAGAGVALVCAPKGGPVTAVKLGGTGVLPEYAWQNRERPVSTDVATPLFYQGQFYVLNTDRKSLSCLDPATGAVRWTGDLGGTAKLEASPTGADGKIYLMNHNGEVFVVKAGDAYQLLAKIPMGGGEGDRELRSTIAVAQGNLFIRTGLKLFCVGN